MKNELEKITTLTEELLALLNDDQSLTSREQTILRMNELIEQREKYIRQLSAPYTETEKLLGQTVVEMNKKITEKMLQLQNDLKADIQQMKKSKQSTQSYVNPYKDIRTVDGMYLDQKK